MDIDSYFSEATGSQCYFKVKKTNKNIQQQYCCNLQNNILMSHPHEPVSLCVYVGSLVDIICFT